MAVLTDEQVGRLAAAPVGHLATADANGRPYVVPFCFAGDGERIYSVLDAKPKRGALMGLRRVRNIIANPRVSVVVDHYEPDWGKLWFILIQGRAEVLETGAERVAAIAMLRAKYPQYRTMDIDDNPVIKITPERVTGWSGAQTA